MIGKVGTFALAALILMAIGCGDSLSGKYEDESGAAMIEFKSGNKAYVTIKVLGVTTESDYEVNGDKVTFRTRDGGNTVFTIEKDGTLSGPLGLKLKKKA
jgi:hypothetical protein